MGKIVRALSADGSALCSAVDTTDIVNEIHRIHGTSATASAAAGRLATAACIMGALMKNETDRLELRINGGGKIGTITTVADYRGNVKCCMDNPFADLPLNSKGKLDVGGIVGTNGYLSVIRDLGMKEPYVGQVAVGAVIMNRVKSSSFPNTIAGVVYQKGAFDAVSDGQINMNPDSTAKKAAQDAINGWDPSYGSIYYFNPATATNKWIWSRPHTVTIGKHRFCK